MSESVESALFSPRSRIWSGITRGRKASRLTESFEGGFEPQPAPSRGLGTYPFHVFSEGIFHSREQQAAIQTESPVEWASLGRPTA